MLRFHLELHGSNASHREPVGLTGQAHLVVLMDVVVQGLVVHRPEGTERAVVRVNSTAGQLHFRLTQGVARVQIPQAHGPRVSKSFGIRVCHVDAVLALTCQHDPVYGIKPHTCIKGVYLPGDAVDVRWQGGAIQGQRRGRGIDGRHRGQHRRDGLTEPYIHSKTQDTWPACVLFSKL